MPSPLAARRLRVLLPDGRVLAAGGAAVLEVFDPTADEFAPIDGSLGRAPYFATATLLDDGDVVLTGGYSDRGPASDEAWLIRPGRAGLRVTRASGGGSPRGPA